MKKIILVLTVSLAVVTAGCATKTRYINKENDTGKPVLSLDYRDFDTAVDELVQSLLVFGVLKKDDGTKYVATTGEIINDTTQSIDTRQLMSLIEEKLMASGQIDMTSAIGNPTDAMIDESRTLRKDKEFDQDTVMDKGQLVGPELSFSGKIFQRTVSYDRKTNQVEYYIELIATNLRTGLRFWQKQVQILKRGSVNTPLW